MYFRTSVPYIYSAARIYFLFFDCASIVGSYQSPVLCASLAHLSAAAPANMRDGRCSSLHNEPKLEQTITSSETRCSPQPIITEAEKKTHWVDTNSLACSISQSSSVEQFEHKSGCLCVYSFPSSHDAFSFKRGALWTKLSPSFTNSSINQTSGGLWCGNEGWPGGR